MSKDLNDRGREGSLPADPTHESTPVTGPRRGKLQIVDPESTAKLPSPSDLPAEAAILSALLWAGQFAPERLSVESVLDILAAEMFYTNVHQTLFDAIAAQHAIKAPTDPTSINSIVLERTRRSQIEYLDKLVGDAMPTNEAQLRGYAYAVRDSWARRELIDHARSVENIAKRGDITASDAIQQSRKALDDLDRLVVSEKGIVTAKEAAFQVVQQMQHDRPQGLATGFTGIDALIGGLVPGETTIVGARTSVGKSAFSFQLAENIVDRHSKAAILYISLEMPGSQFVVRAASARSSVDAYNFRANNWPGSTRTQFQQAVVEIAQKNIFFADTQTQTMQSITGLVKKCAQSCMRTGLTLVGVMIDHLLLIKSTEKGRERHDQLADVSRWMKGMADHYRTSVIGLSQISRASEKQGNDKRPELIHLKYSGALEEDADNVILIHRERLKSGQFADKNADIIVGKARNGRTGSFEMSVSSQFVRFNNIEDERMVSASRDYVDPRGGSDD